jgi:divalent metal cation (Fe/Co/Zn/Cd) transporter
VVDNSDHYKIHEDKQKAEASIITKANAQNEKVKVATISIAASASLAILKLVIGFSTNSLGILSEAFHSGLDTIAALMTL